jgi:hypothetical protein
VNILNKLNKSNAARFGLGLVACLCLSRAAKAEVALVDKDGWTFTFEGRVNSFLSVGKGDDLPLPTQDPNAPMSSAIVMGFNGQAGVGRGDVGWPSAYQTDANNKYFGVRVRSGMLPNILGFGLTKRINEDTFVRGYISIWSTVESLGRDKWYPVIPEAREGYFTGQGPWGSVTVGRTLGWLGRTSYEIDLAYGHGYGVGLPCTDALGPACGHIGTGVLFPGYSAGLAYSTPSIGGLQLHVGVYDPVEIVPFGGGPGDWTHASVVRPEGSITFMREIKDGLRIGFAVEGAYQPIGRTVTDATTMAKHQVNSSIWGASGGLRVEGGPLRVGASAFHGRGIGLGYALASSVAAADNDSAHAPCLDTDNDPTTPCVNTNTFELRTFTGYYGQAALVFGRVHLASGYGIAMVDQVPADKLNTLLSVIHYQQGISAAFYYQVSDSVVLGLDYFHYLASWYGRAASDSMGNPNGGKLAGEKQVLDFFNAGATYHW